MQQVNGYFKISLDGLTGKCHIYPPQGNGKALDYKELSSFLDRCGFSSYNPNELNQALKSGTECEVNLGTKADAYEINDFTELFVASDRMSATLSVMPGSLKGNRLTVKDIMGELLMSKIKFGIDQEAILDFVKNPVYCQPFVVAKGKPADNGKDASIEYFFNTNPDRKPAVLEDGSVDFHNLSVISEINKGDLLARLIPEVRGVPGTDIYGSNIPPKAVSSARLSIGRNITLNEAKTEAYSDVTGHVSLTCGQIFVSDVYEVPADVDTSTGDINFAGSVNIKGNVKDGFSVVAEGDIVVEGSVEGALLSAGGDVIIKRGINGKSKGVIDAKGNVIAKFIENGKIFAGGYVQTGASINSQITAAGDVSVTDKKGFVVGGVIKSGGKITACTIGSEMGSMTKIEIGADPKKKEAFQSLQKSIQDITAEINKIQPVITTYAQVVQSGKQLDEKNKSYYIQLLNVLKADQEKLTQAQTKYSVLYEEMNRVSDSKVLVTKDIYPGVYVSFGDVSITVKEKRSYCTIEKKNGEVVYGVL